MNIYISWALAGSRAGIHICFIVRKQGGSFLTLEQCPVPNPGFLGVWS